MKISKSLACALGVAAAVALAIGCSKSSTGPSDPFVGNWSIAWSQVAAGQALSPSPWTITVAKNGSVYTATYANLTWTYTGGAGVIDTYSATADSSMFAIRNDSLLLRTQDPIALACTLTLVGTISGTTAIGTVQAAGVLCVPGAWVFTATKQ